MEYWALVMFAVLFGLLLLGYPVAFTLGAISLLFGSVFLGYQFFDLLPFRIWGVMTNFTLLAVPLFVFMGVVLEKSGVAEQLLSTMSRVFAGIRGGLAVAVVIVGAMLAATTGVVGASVVTMAVIALPTMLKYGYAPSLASGTVAASGTLGQIIPPSIILILLGDVIGVSVGELFIAAVIPGLILISAYIVYIIYIASKHPDLAPPANFDHSDETPLWQAVLKSLLPPFVLILAVLGSIFFGIASPTESAAVGAFGALVLAAIHRRLTLPNLQDAMQKTLRLTSMVFIIFIGATAFGLVFVGMGGDKLILDIFSGMPGGKWTFLVFSMLMIFLLGFFLDFIEICFIVVPILAPVAIQLGIDPLWFALLIAINLQTSFLTPPFGFSLFYLKASAPASIKLQSIYRGIVPFVGIQLVVLALLIAVPEISLWLPQFMNG